MKNKNIQSIYRLAPVQEGVLFHCLKAPDAGFYFQQVSYQLALLEDPRKWQASWQTVVERHPVMRSFFTWEKRDHPLQIVREHSSMPWRELDWQLDSESVQQQKWQALLRTDRDQGVSFSKAPMLRFTLVRIAENNFRFLFSFHHILLDGWSQRLLFDEALALYRGQAPLELPTPPAYEKFIKWLDGQDKKAALQHWQNTLAGLQQPSHISKEGKGQSNSSTMQSLQLSEHSFVALKRIAREHHLTLNTLVLGAMSVMMAAETRCTDVVFGTTVAGRPTDLPAIETTAGLFINSIPFRSQLEAKVKVRDWLAQMQSAQTANLQYSYVGLRDIQRVCDMPVNSELFDTLLVFENLPVQQQSTGLPPLVQNIEYQEYSHYPLAILVDPSDGLNLIAVHQHDKVSSPQATRLLTMLQTLLVQLSRSLEMTIGELELLNDQQKSRYDIAVSETLCNAAQATGIHQLVEHWADSTPQQHAIRAYRNDGSLAETLNYAQLNQRANQLARHLQSRGVAQGQYVAVLLDKSATALIAMLAIVKVGATYIPMDPGHPVSRVQAIFDDLPEQAVNIITRSDVASRFALAADRLVLIDNIASELANQLSHNLTDTTQSSSLAYVIYTSGSTGTPKGVMVSHRALLHSTRARTDYYPDPPSRFLLLSSLATDSSIAGIYWSLTTGNTLVLPAPRVEQDMAGLGKLIAASNTSHLLCIPSLYALLLEHGNIEQLTDLQSVIVAGEACPEHLVGVHQSTLTQTRLYNEYGPSEYTVWASVAELTNRQTGQGVSIGKPISATQMLLVSPLGQLVPQGVIGELYLAGNGLASGYLNQPERSAESFVDNTSITAGILPLSQTLYRSGDLVREGEDGQYYYLGRADNQLKIRGFRVEPEEVEALLQQHPDIRDAVVFAAPSIDTTAAGKVTITELLSQLSKLDPETASQLIDQVSTTGNQSL
jgi:amino acid adenylation domain-containing protein